VLFGLLTVSQSIVGVDRTLDLRATNVGRQRSGATRATGWSLICWGWATMANPLVILDELDKAQALGKTSGGFSPPTGAAHGRLLTSGTKRKWVRHLRVPLKLTWRVAALNNVQRGTFLFMKAADLCKLVGCSPSALKQWVKEGVVLANADRKGSGNHLVYDDANVIAAAIALRLRDLGMTVSRSQVAFHQLHVELRARSSIEWLSLWIEIGPKYAKLIDARSVSQISGISAWVVIDLAQLCETFIHPRINSQLELSFGLHSANPLRRVG
jgi:DNA-binding transcriptional MerR regulator